MNMTSLDTKDIVANYVQISEEEARELLQRGEKFIMRLNSRDYYRNVSIGDLEQSKRLRGMGIYDRLEFYKPQ